MASGTPLQNVRGWLLHRVWTNYWSIAAIATILAPITVLLVLQMDRAFLTDALIARDLTPVASADTARDFAGIAAGIDTAFMTLYFSITLIVLSMAAGNLGVRLIDRWLEKSLVRITISVLSFSLVASLGTMLAIDPDAVISQTPLGLVLLVFGLQLAAITTLCVALYDLGRTMFIDTSIAALANDAKLSEIPIVSKKCGGDDFVETITATRAGYIEGTDIGRIVQKVQGQCNRVRILASAGMHVLEGQALVQLSAPFDDAEAIRQCIPIGENRSNSEGTVYQVRLLVEIAARALSPAINDFYTALACADGLAEVISASRDRWIDDGDIAAYADDPRFELPGRDFKGLFEDPLNAFRQAACQYPSVSIRMIDNYRRICETLHQNDRSEGFILMLAKLARDLAEHAQQVTQFDRDSQDLSATWRDFEALIGEWNITLSN